MNIKNVIEKNWKTHGIPGNAPQVSGVGVTESQKLQPESSFTGRDQQCCYFMVNKQGLSGFSFAMVNSGKEKLSHLSPDLLCTY